MQRAQAGAVCYSGMGQGDNRQEDRRGREGVGTGMTAAVRAATISRREPRRPKTRITRKARTDLPTRAASRPASTRLINRLNRPIPPQGQGPRLAYNPRPPSPPIQSAFRLGAAKHLPAQRLAYSSPQRQADSTRSHLAQALPSAPSRLASQVSYPGQFPPSCQPSCPSPSKDKPIPLQGRALPAPTPRHASEDSPAPRTCPPPPARRQILLGPAQTPLGMQHAMAP